MRGVIVVTRRVALPDETFSGELTLAARSISMQRWLDWGERERLVVNLTNIYGELEGAHEPVNPLVAFQQMAELAASDQPASE
jgi:hypothetical protein